MAENKEKIVNEIILQFIEMNDENGNHQTEVRTSWTKGISPNDVIAHIEMTKQSIINGILSGKYKANEKGEYDGNK